ncbi:MAG: acyl-CoA dehydrogenase family protein [Candidatus Hydrogenedentes bacterium]|nr:acyl-CoA dehydrogenase family protein [Candidatus Hydrogenedentota bacterium]
MSSTENKAKDKAMDLAEDARQAEWAFPSFTAELFRGNFRWDLMHPFPAQDAEDKKIGDDYIARVREVLDKYVDPVEIDRSGVYPKEALKAFAEIGAFGMKISKEYGGVGLSQTNYSRVLSVLGSYCQSTTTWLSAHQSIGVPQPLKMYGTEEQKKKFLPRLAAGEISAFALTEPEVGSDPARVACTATPSDDGSYYLLNGEKLWCTNGPDADILVVMAQTPPKIVNGKERPQITAFIVEKTMPGFAVEHRCSFMGLKGLSNGLLSFKNVKVPAENIIGKPGQGLKIALATLNTGRLGIPAATAGAAKVCVEHARKWASTRVQWGVPIGKHQAIAKKIANMAADTFAMESVVWAACAFADKENADIRLEAAIAKYFCTETGWRLIDDYIQVRGGRGFETELSLFNRGEEPIVAERFMRDSRVGRIFEGSTEIMHLIMAREAMDTHFKLAMPIMKPKPGQKESKAALIWKAVKFYVPWYLKLLLPSTTQYNTKHLSSANQDHLAFVDKTCRKLARTLVHTMAKYGPKLEFEQLILGNFVDIGVDLFTMASSLAYAEHHLAQSPGDASPQELADLYCQNARTRIAANFKAVRSNHNRAFNKVADSLMDGKYGWMTKDVMIDFPRSLRRDPAKERVEEPADEHAHVK